jgi:predicted CxxxxCH...CXXCH cytochrome family protein
VANPILAAPPDAVAARIGGTQERVGAHQAHLNADIASPVACATCHEVPNSLSHVSGNSARASVNASIGYAAGTCTNTCHGFSASPQWTSSGLQCNGCHGRSTANGAPDYQTGSPKANSHASHAYTCNTCHAGTTANGTAITTAALHVNGAYDVAPGAGAAFTYTYAATGGTCSNISCHSGGSSTWGVPGVSHEAANWGDYPGNVGFGEVMVFELANEDVTDHGAGTTSWQSCSNCHYANIKTQHANQCNVCHGAGKPADQIGTWDKTCSACHPSNLTHTGSGSDHFGELWNSSASCDMCHGWDAGGVTTAECGACHAPPGMR